MDFIAGLLAISLLLLFMKHLFNNFYFYSGATLLSAIILNSLFGKELDTATGGAIAITLLIIIPARLLFIAGSLILEQLKTSGISFSSKGRRIRKIANYNLYEVDVMDGITFEYFIADVLKNTGFRKIKVLSASGDYGIDVIAEKDGFSYGFQCKRWESNIGIKAIQETFAGKKYYDLDIGIVITNSYFTQAAINLADSTDIYLWDRNKLKEILYLLDKASQHKM